MKIYWAIGMMWVGMVGFISMPLRLNAQYYFDHDGAIAGSVRYELGLSAGGMNCLSDLGGSKHHRGGLMRDVEWGSFRPAVGLYFLALFRDALGLRIGYTRGRVSASDEGAGDLVLGSIGREMRNLSFRSAISEFNLLAEVHPLFFRQYDEDESPYLSPYVVVGIGNFHFSPEAKLDGKWIPLAQLCLEGQGFAEYSSRKRYGLQQFNLPVGIGMKYELSSSVSLRVEVLHRILFTDYLDDVSMDYIDPKLFKKYLPPDKAMLAALLYNRMRELDGNVQLTGGLQRGNPKNNDAFFSIEVKIGIRIKWKRMM